MSLTKEQKREAERAIYGLDAIMNNELSSQDIERMRAILAEHDRQENKSNIREFDLNNPPKVPYVHQEYPMMVYHHEGRRHKVVQNVAEEKAALEAGWRNKPFVADLPEPELLDPREAAEVEQLDRIARRPRKDK